MSTVTSFTAWSIIRRIGQSCSLLRHPLCLALALALALCCPYLLVFDGDLLQQRLISAVLYSSTLVALAWLLGAGRLAALLLSSLTLLYTFSSYCEIGNYLVKGDTFHNEFWLFADQHGLLLSLQTAPLLASLGLMLPLLIGAGVFLTVQEMALPWKSAPKVVLLTTALLIVAAGLWANLRYASIAEMARSYAAFTEMTGEAAQARYLRSIPGRGQIRAKPGKNILHIVLESFGDIYTDNKRFPGLAPHLAGYKKQGLSAAKMVQTPNQANSYMGHFVTEFGRYYFINPEAAEQEAGLGYVLHRAGYRNLFLRGAGPDMAGPFSWLYSPDHGYESFIASHILEKKYDPATVSGFGFSDETLFAEALSLYRQLIQGQKPFMLTLFTLDMHGFPQGISEICKQPPPYSGPFQDDAMVQAARCTDSLVGDFLQHIAQLPRYEELLIVLHADHVQHNLTPAIMPDSRKIYSVIMGAGVAPFQQKQETHLMDIAPTVLSLAGVTSNARFYAGDDFSVPMTRAAILDQELEAERYSNDESLKKFSRIKAPPLEQFDRDSLHHFQDDQLDLTFAKLDGPIFSSLLLYLTDRGGGSRSNPPIFVLYPVGEHTPKLFLPYKGIIMEKNGKARYTTGVSLGVASRWKGVILEELTSGARWRIGFADQTMVSLASPPLSSRQQLSRQQLSRQPIFETTGAAAFKEMSQMEAIGNNQLKVLAGDARMYLELPLSRKTPHLVVMEITAPQDDVAKLYYELNGDSYSELNASSGLLKQGKNRVQFFLPRGSYGERFRFDIGEKTGTFTLSSCRIYALPSP